MAEAGPNVLPSPLPAPEPNSVFARLYTYKPIATADATLAHLTRLMSTTSGVDSTLALVYYTILLARSQVSRILNFRTEQVARSIARKAAQNLLPGETLIATITTNMAEVAARGGFSLPSIHTRLKALATLISDFRTFSRLWGLLGVYAWAKSTLLNGPRDSLLLGVAWAQVCLNAFFFGLENTAYLANKGFFPNWSKKRISRHNSLAARAFVVHMYLQYVKYARQKYLRMQEEAKIAASPDKDTEEARAAREKEEDAWRRGLLITAAFTPLAFHWSTPGGLVSEFWVGLLGTTASAISFREVWKGSAI